MKVIARETIAYIKTPSSSCLYLKQVYDIPHNFAQIQALFKDLGYLAGQIRNLLEVSHSKIVSSSKRLSL